MTRSVADAAVILGLLTGIDPADVASGKVREICNMIIPDTWMQED
jgi:hypothetical protein